MTEEMKAAIRDCMEIADKHAGGMPISVELRRRFPEAWEPAPAGARQRPEPTGEDIIRNTERTNAWIEAGCPEPLIALTPAEIESGAIFIELLYQWDCNHAEHCRAQWPHPDIIGDVVRCHWPLPPSLAKIPRAELEALYLKLKTSDFQY